jgi:hypothetical protein
MHHFIFPSQDTYVTNRPYGLDVKNFGVDEILQVGTQNNLVAYISDTKDYVYVSQSFNNIGVEYFNGTFTGSLHGVDATQSYAILTPLGGTGSIYLGLFTYTDFTGSITSGSYICLFGTASGTDTRTEKTRLYKNQAFTDRALIQFDLLAISRSIVAGDIQSASFHLKVKVCNEYQLPIDYSIYAFPLAESWIMGNGYMSDGGSDEGASWVYRDLNGGTPWLTPGGTLTGPVCTQSFHYKSADIDMDVTSIVNAWLGGLPNNGLVLVTSDEFYPTGSGFTLKYFSEDTNTIYSPLLDVMWNNGWEFITGSISTGSVTITTASGSSTFVDANTSTFYIDGGVHGNFSGSAWINVVYISESLAYFDNSFISASGFSGNIAGAAVYGPVSGSYNTQSVAVILPAEIHYRVPSSPMESPYAAGPYPATTNPYTYLNQEYYWNGYTWVSTTPITPDTPYSTSCGISHSVHLMSGMFMDGPFSQSFFNAYYADYQILFADLTGSWTTQSLAGTSVYIPLPQATYPYVTAYIQGPYVYGTALGLYTIYTYISASVTQSSTMSASFRGQIVSGPLAGGQCFFQLSGSAATTPYSYTSSVSYNSSSFEPLDTKQQFSINLQNLQPTYKAGDIVKINVFARPKFPWKDFGVLTQQRAYLVPEYLPTSSYWALKDNQTDEIVVNFDSYTQISCGYPEGNYFLVDTTSLPQERFYRILIRVDDGVQVDTIDTGKTFKITR